MSEDLRTLFKVDRDLRERGYPPQSTLDSMRRRASDRDRYIQPQLPLADLVIRLEPAVPLDTDWTTVPEIPVLNVRAVIKDSNLGEEIAQALRSLADAQAEVEYLERPGSVSILVSGTDWIRAADLAAVADHLVRRPDELFLSKPAWQSGSRGVMQLLLVLALLERRQPADIGDRT